MNNKTDKEQNNELLKKKNNKKVKQLSNTFYTTSLLVVFLAFKIYFYITEIPQMPELTMDSWWGPNDTRTQQDTSIRRYRIVFPESAQNDLNTRFEFHRIRRHVKSFKDSHFSYGFNSEVLDEVSNFWKFNYNLREREKYFNKYNQFMTNIEGLDIHFVHVKPKVQDNVEVYPIVLLHGWPGSIKEFYEVIPFLTNKRPGINFVFEVIIPSLPGFGYSQAPIKPGLCPYKIAIIINKLMNRIGFSKYYLHAGDIGHQIATYLTTIHPETILGYHTSKVFHFHGFTNLAWVAGSILPKLVLEKQLEEIRFPLVGLMQELGFLHMHMTKPDSLGPSLQDSPLGLAAYILEPFLTFTYPSLKNQTEGLIERRPLTDLIDNVVLYWFSGCITTSMRVYAEFWSDLNVANIINSIPTSVPTWGLRSKHELLFQPDFLIRRKFANFLGSTSLEEGGPYIALEMPQVLADDIFKAVNKFLEIFSAFHSNYKISNTKNRFSK